MSSESSDRHHAAAAGRGPVPVAIVTVSDSRTPETDGNAAYLRERTQAAGHTGAGYRLIRAEPAPGAGALHAVAPAGAPAAGGPPGRRVPADPRRAGAGTRCAGGDGGGHGAGGRLQRRD